MQQQELDFFLGALSPTGFSSYYTQVVKDAETQTSALLKAGPGCGKSTLGRTILHLLESSEGQIIFDGRDITHIKGKELGKLRQEKQIIFQDPFSSRRTARYINTLFHEEYITSYLIIAEYIANV